MIAPGCYVVAASEFQQAMDVLGQVILFLLVMVWCASVDWHRTFDLLRRILRRRRIRAIRARRVFRA